MNFDDVNESWVTEKEQLVPGIYRRKFREVCDEYIKTEKKQPKTHISSLIKGVVTGVLLFSIGHSIGNSTFNKNLEAITQTHLEGEIESKEDEKALYFLSGLSFLYGAIPYIYQRANSKRRKEIFLKKIQNIYDGEELG